MIEVTDEMVRALKLVHRDRYQFGVANLDQTFREGIAAALAIAERQWQEQYGDAFQAGWWRGQHELCPRCGVALEREVRGEGVPARCNRTSRCIREDAHTGPHAFTGLDPQ